MKNTYVNFIYLSIRVLYIKFLVCRDLDSIVTNKKQKYNFNSFRIINLKILNPCVFHIKIYTLPKYEILKMFVQSKFVA